MLPAGLRVRVIDRYLWTNDRHTGMPGISMRRTMAWLKVRILSMPYYGEVWWIGWKTFSTTPPAPTATPTPALLFRYR